MVEAILKYRKKGKVFHFLTLIKDDANHDAESRPTQDFFDTDEIEKEVFYHYFKNNGIMEHLWSNQSNDAVGTAAEEGTDVTGCFFRNIQIFRIQQCIIPFSSIV